MSERERLFAGQTSSYGTTNGDLSSPVKVTFENLHIQTSQGSDSSKSTTVIGTSLRLPTSQGSNSQISNVSMPTTDNHQPEAANRHRGSGAVHQATETSPRGVMVTNHPQSHPTQVAGNSRIRNWKRHWRCVACVALVIGGIIIAFPACFVWMAHSSSATPVYAGDVVQVSSVKIFWFNQVKIRQQPPEGEEPAEASIYKENCASKERLNRTNFSSRPLTLTHPQGLDSLQQQYLLAGSDLTINLTIHADSDGDSSAKVCQYGNADDYNALLSAVTKAEVDEAEKNGFCQLIEPSSASSLHTTVIQFNIYAHGYYYYALAVVPGEQMIISYNYTLGRKYYDKNELTSLNCSVVDHQCTINGFTKITAENCILTFIPPPAAIEPSILYTFHSEQRIALGIDIVYICIVLGMVLICFIIVLVLVCSCLIIVCWVYCKKAPRVVV